MYLKCKKCGESVKWEPLRLGKLERNVYNCANQRCPYSVLNYVPDEEPLPSWIEYSIVFEKAN